MSIGNLKTDGGKGTNWPWQRKMLKGLDNIAAAVVTGGQDFEAQTVIDSANVVWLEIRLYDPDTGTFGTPQYYAPGSTSPGSPTLPVEYAPPLVPQSKTTNIQRETDALNSPIAAGAFSVSIANVGAAAGTIKGETLNAGETINFDAGATNNTLDAIAFDATGTEFLIISIT